jgi:hypothetical protein
MVVTQPTASTDSTCSPPAIAPLRWLSCRCHLYADLNPRLSARSAVKIDWKFAVIRGAGSLPFVHFVGNNSGSICLATDTTGTKRIFRFCGSGFMPRRLDLSGHKAPPTIDPSICGNGERYRTMTS